MQPETQIPPKDSYWQDKAALTLLILVGMDLFVVGPFLSFVIWPWPYFVIPPMLLIALVLKLTSPARSSIDLGQTPIYIAVSVYFIQFFGSIWISSAGNWKDYKVQLAMTSLSGLSVLAALCSNRLEVRRSTMLIALGSFVTSLFLASFYYWWKGFTF